MIFTRSRSCCALPAKTERTIKRRVRKLGRLTPPMVPPPLPLRAQVLFLCCLPAHLPRVAKEMTQVRAAELSWPARVCQLGGALLSVGHTTL
jgi:hypothetical protein